MADGGGLGRGSGVALGTKVGLALKVGLAVGLITLLGSDVSVTCGETVSTVLAFKPQALSINSNANTRLKTVTELRMEVCSLSNSLLRNLSQKLRLRRVLLALS